MAIRWDSDYTKKAQRIVSNFNKRLGYQESYGAQYLPEKASMAYIRETFTNRRDLNRYLRQLERFNAKSAQVVRVGIDNTKMTKWEKQNLISNRASSRAKIMAGMRKTINRQGARVHEFERGEAYLTMKNELRRLSRPLASLSTSQIRSNEAINLKYREMAKRSKKFKRNFFDILFKDVIQAGGDISQAGRIEQKLSQLTPEQLTALYNDSPHIKYLVEHYHLYTAKVHDASLDQNGKVLLENELDVIESMVDVFIAKYSSL